MRLLYIHLLHQLQRTKSGHDLEPDLMVPPREAGMWAGAAGALTPEPSTWIEHWLRFLAGQVQRLGAKIFPAMVQ